jgi:hypothetical protein
MIGLTTWYAQVSFKIQFYVQSGNAIYKLWNRGFG